MATTITAKIFTNKSETLFLTPTVAVEKHLKETAIRFAFLHYVFNVEISKVEEVSWQETEC